jgi:hypothetical protein
MSAGVLIVGMILAGVIGTLVGIWAAEREIELLDNRILDLERELHRNRLDSVIDRIEREGI